MYDDYTTLFEQLRGTLPADAVDTLQQIFTQCRLPLKHNGPVTLDYPSEYSATAGEGGLSLFMPSWTTAKFAGDLYVGDTLFNPLLDLLPVHAVIQWAGAAADVPTKWAIMDGTRNSVANGGSGIDMSGHFVKGLAIANDPPDNTAAGASTHDHGTNTNTASTGLTVSNSSASNTNAAGTGVSATNAAGTGVTTTNAAGTNVTATYTATTSLTIANHPSHTHPLTTTNYALQIDGGSFNAFNTANPSTGTEDASPLNALNHAITDAGHAHGIDNTSHSHGIDNTSHSHGIDNTSHSHAIPVHNHATSETAHAHGITAGSNEYLNKQLYFIEKIAA